MLLPIMLAMTLLSACDANSNKVKYDALEKADINDNYRNYYQIFPISFADSDGNGKGDLRGVIDKLDYLASMNYNGIWLNPIHNSSTSHHYDVEDYFSVDSRFGGFAAFDELITKAHEKGFKVIIDMVLNHSSNKNEWFEESYYAAKGNKKTSVAYNRYNWIDCTGAAPTGYRKMNDSDKVAYEGQFDTTMPDFNLQQILDDGVNSDLAVKFKEIFRFWLIDHDVDGFRLDACTQFFTNDMSKNKAFLTWLNTECKALKSDCYIVGEANWGSNSVENKTYQESGVDSFFQFGNSGKNIGYPIQAVVQQNAKAIYNGLRLNRENANGGIEAPFLSNHDVPRYVGAVSGRGDPGNTKFALGTLQMLGGSTFMYYGDEVGMASQTTVADGWFRLPIRWGDKYTCDISKLSLYGVSPSTLDEEASYPFDTVAKQLKSSSSIANYAKKANLIRLALPQIARGDFELSYENTKSFVVIKRTYNGESIYVAINASFTTPVTYDFSSLGTTPVAELCVKGNVTYGANKTTVNIPTQSIFIFK